MVTLGEAIEEDLHVGCSELWQEVKIRFASGWSHTAETPTVGVLMLNTPHRLHPSYRDATAPNRHQPPAALVLTPQAQRATVGYWYGLAHLLHHCGAERLLVFRVLLYAAGERLWGGS